MTTTPAHLAEPYRNYAIRRAYQSGNWTYAGLAKQYGVSKTRIEQIINIEDYRERRRLQLSRINVVYFIECAGFVKIGIAADLNRRLACLQSSCPLPLQVLGTHPGGRELEADYHRRFRHLHSHSEWFKDSPEIRELIKWLCQDQDSPLSIAVSNA